ncbi:hypothetical protein [Bradyrhizobium sp. BR 1432]|uniref:hypothetical protein n=1 Tax=Bradyrhizobium sp. BR 1432 TaxID=3447966 RepID=UPI003EE7403C
MTEVKKVTQPQFLRSVPKLQPFTFIPSDSGGNLQVDIGETVNVGAKPDVDETVDGRALKWIFVEATTGQQIDKRKGFVLDEFLASADTDVPTSDGFEPFSTQVNREDYANTCYLQAALNGTNPAYLYALAFASSGDQWSATVVKTDDPPGALAFGVYRFSKKAWQQQTTQPEAEGIEPDDIKFPDVQCIMAAILAAKSAELLKGKITDRPLTAVDLMLAFLCNDTAGFGSEAAVTILQADKTKSAATVLTAIYPDPSERAAFFKRNAHIFKDNGSATIDEALTECASRLAAGFAEADKIADNFRLGRIWRLHPLDADRPNSGRQRCRFNDRQYRFSHWYRPWRRHRRQRRQWHRSHAVSERTQQQPCTHQEVCRHGEGGGRLGRSAQHQACPARNGVQPCHGARAFPRTGFAIDIGRQATRLLPGRRERDLFAPGHQRRIR